MKTFSYLFGATLAIGGLTTLAQGATIANFTFETSGAVATANPRAAEVGVGTASVNTGGTISSPAGNSPDGGTTTSLYSFSSNGWDVGEYFDFAVPTTGFTGISVSLDATGSNTGPSSFAFAYSTDGTTFTNFATYTLTADGWNTTADAAASAKGPFDLSAITAANNNALFKFRLIDNSTVSINNGTVASGGTSRVDNVLISGTPVPEPTTLAALAGVALVGFRRRRA